MPSPPRSHALRVRRCPATPLLREPHGFEGLVHVQIDARSRDPIVVPEMYDHRERELDRNAAGSPAPLNSADLDHLAADLADVSKVDTPPGKLLIDVARPLFDPCLASIRLADDG